MLTDFHAHIYPDHTAEKIISGMEDFYGVRRKHDATLSSLLGSMDKAGIGRAVLLPVATKPEHVKYNDWYSEISKDNPRIVSFGLIHPDNDPAELDRFPELGLIGIKIQPNAQRAFPSDKRYFPIYKKAAELGLIVTFHTGHEEGGVKGEFSQPPDYIEVIESFPEITFILAHLGGYKVWKEAEVLHKYSNVWFDNAYVAGNCPDDEHYKLAAAIGFERILFGTDFPFRDHREEREKIERIFGAKASLFLRENPSRLLDLFSR